MSRIRFPSPATVYRESCPPCSDPSGPFADMNKAGFFEHLRPVQMRAINLPPYSHYGLSFLVKCAGQYIFSGCWVKFITVVLI